MDNIAKINKKLYFWVVFLILLLLISVTLYFKGYRITSGLKIGKIGSLALVLPYADTSVFIDNSQKLSSATDNQTLDVKLTPTSHTIIVSKDGYFPWKKDITIPSSGNITLNPVFIPSNTSGEVITSEDKDYIKIKSLVLKNELPTREKPLYSSDQSTFMWVEDNAIVTQSGSLTHRVIQPDTIIKNVDFYKNRNDLVIFTIDNAIYLIESDSSGGQNFLPIYKGKDPNFVRADDNSIYILDGNTLMQVVI